MTADGRCAPREFRARAILIAACILALVGLTTGCGWGDEQTACVKACGTSGVASVSYGCSGACICRGATADAGTRQ